MKGNIIFVAYCLLKVISHYVITLSEWVSVIIESKPTTNSLLISIQYFPIFAPFYFGASSVVQHLSRIALNGLECYSELAHDHTKNLWFSMCSQSCQVIWCINWKTSSFFIMSVNHLSVRIKCSCLRIYGELVSKEFSFQRFRKCTSLSKCNWVFTAAEHLCLVAISNPFKESFLLQACSKVVTRRERNQELFRVWLKKVI